MRQSPETDLVQERSLGTCFKKNTPNTPYKKGFTRDTPVYILGNDGAVHLQAVTGVASLFAIASDLAAPDLGEFSWGPQPSLNSQLFIGIYRNFMDIWVWGYMNMWIFNKSFNFRRMFIDAH